MKKKIYKVIACALAGSLLLAGCGQSGSSSSGSQTSDQSTVKAGDTSSAADQSKKEKTEAPEIAGQTYKSTMDLEYATEFDIYYYEIFFNPKTNKTYYHEKFI